MSAFCLACLGYAILALPASTGGLLWPSIRVSLHQPLGALGGLLALSVVASVAASVATGRLLSRLSAASILATGTVLCGLGAGVDALAPTVWLFAAGMVVGGLGFGAVDAGFNAYAARHFDARQITGMHASYGVGATAGPLLATALLGAAVSWRWIFALLAAVQIGLAALLAAGRGAWVALPATVPVPAGVPVPVEPDPAQPARNRPRVGVVVGSLVFTTVETGIEAAAGVWGFVFLTAGRGLASAVAGAAVSGYWAMVVVGRIVLGLAAERLGAGRVLGAAV
ncbi:MAG: MFS transporter, partial [Micromonosporaceae bacterium]|nr:MFS transporter [Micromonosporaceae bacterium]